LPSVVRPRFSRGVYRAALTRFDLLIANSVAVRESARAFARPFRLERVVVLPNGVEPAPPPRGRRERTDRIAFIGRAGDPDKGLDVLLAALPFLDDRVQAILVGEGVPEAARAAGLHPRHRVFPATPQPWDVLGDVDALVVPSRREGSPNVVLEAFAREVPVIGTRVGGLGELLAEDRGRVLPPEQPDLLAAEIAAVLRDPAVSHERARRARAYAERVHAWPRVVAGFDAELSALVRSARRRRRSLHGFRAHGG
jgi:glycosyltransferase involved in cell wall biosynthesis